MINCNRKHIAQFLANELSIDDKLDFLFHLDNCTTCWEEVYAAVRAQHAHYYKSPSRRMKLSKKQVEPVKEKVFEVA